MASSSKDSNYSDEQNLVKAGMTQIQAETLNVVKTDAITQSLQPKTSELHLTETSILPIDSDFKPKREPAPTIAVKDKLSLPLLRFPLKPIPRPQVSTFLPTTQNLFEVVYFMDCLISDDNSFQNTGLPWHPFISNIYFAVLTYIQALRAMLHARQGSPATRLWTEQFLRDYPPERLPIPGPLLPIFKSICTSQPKITQYGLISPLIPEIIGPNDASELFMENTAYACLPNVPFLIGLANSIIQAQPEEIPDYDDPATFTEGNTPHINEAHFPNVWTQDIRILLSQPGSLHRPTVSADIVETFNSEGINLNLPVLDNATPTRSIQDFLCLNISSWFDNIIPIMAEYSTHFKESSHLGDCSPFGPPTGLVSTRLTTLSSQTAALNQIYNLTSAFPGTFPFKYIYDVRSYELEIPQPFQLMAQFAAINTRIDYHGMNPIYTNTPATTRQGPYWNQNPSNLRQPNCTAFSNIEELIACHYFISQ